jgi:HK97 gp10 family phage protein
MPMEADLARIQARLAAIPDVVRKAGVAAAEKGAEIIAEDMRSLALASKDTGDLIASITVTPSGGQTPAYSQPGGATTVAAGSTMITVGNDAVRYPHLVEYGWSKAEAQPFFWPAVRANSKRVRARINRAVKKAIRDNWGK